jgi:adenosylhomocysteine nucleosidase
VEGFHGLVVDMEAAAVAKVAAETGIGFRCVKAISDEADFVMPPLARFVDAEGNFQSGKFAAWAAVRPWEWARVITLGRKTSKAVRALCEWLEKNAPGDAPAEAVRLKSASLRDVIPGRR